MLRRCLALFDRAPEHWTELAPRNWRAGYRGGPQVGPNGFVRFLVSGDGEPLGLTEAGELVGIDSGAPYDSALVAERTNMGWLLRLDREDVRRALHLAATIAAGERVLAKKTSASLEVS